MLPFICKEKRMRQFRISKNEYRTLSRKLEKTSAAKDFRRIQAIILASEGRPIGEIVSIIKVTVQTIHNWLDRYQHEHRPNAMLERKHTGRPPKKVKVIKPIINKLLSKSPKDLGYRFSVWTVGLIKKHIKQEYQITVGDSTIRRCLHKLKYRCKRPRYSLALCSRTWQSEKGGLNAT